MAFITYTDKQAVGTQPSVPDENKVMDTDLNQIKEAINNSTKYSSTETIIGYDSDDKPIYRLDVHFTGGQMVVNAWTNCYSLANVKRLYKAIMGADNNNTVAVWNDVMMSWASGQVRYFSTGAHYTNWIILEYTKTTD